ncbi:MAG: hypothetical protein L3J89_12775 [Gammaproteobacteria bacterium]|nr:hypothetical protein [Gammaproteobacteria bacterium]
MVPGGALSGDEWYLFPVRALSHHFRGAMVSAIRRPISRTSFTASVIPSRLMKNSMV